MQRRLDASCFVGIRVSVTRLRSRVLRGEQLGGVSLVQLENGVRAARIRTLGGIDALVILDRAMDIAWCSFRGTPLVWNGPGALLPPHPGTLNDDEFQRRFFGGLVTTCGLEAFGPAGSDEYGTWGQHGHVNHTAATEIAVTNAFDAEEPYMELRGMVRQVRMFGESLRLERVWRASLYGRELMLHDRVTNDGGSAVPHMLLYHCNAGYPLLDEELTLTLPQTGMAPRDDEAKRGLAEWNRGGQPDASFQEQVFVHSPSAGAGRWCVATFANPRIERSLSVGFQPDQLPACFSWRMLGEGTYVMAVEPANCPTIEGRIAAAETGTLPFLQPGETRAYDLRFGFGETS